MKLNSRRITVSVAVSVLFIALVSAILMLPRTMDEFGMYQVLSCMQEAQQINTYFNSCGEYMTSVGSLEFERSFAYVGVVSSFLLLPFFTVAPYLLTSYVLGIIVLVLVVVLVQRAFKMPIQALPVGLFFFPTLYTILHDAGPIRVSLLALVITPFIALKFVSSNRFKFIWIIVLSTLWLLATDDKPFFLYLTPGIAVFALAVLRYRGNLELTARKMFSLLSFFGIALAISVSYLLILQADNQPYLLYLKSITPHISLESRFNGLVSGVLLTFDWPIYAHRTLGYLGEGASHWRSIQTSINAQFTDPDITVDISFLFAILLSLIVTCIVAFLYFTSIRAVTSAKKIDNEGSVSGVIPLLITASLTLAAGALATGGWANHHYVYFQIPLMTILMLYASLNKRYLVISTGLVLTATVFSIISISVSPTRDNANSEVETVFKVAETSVTGSEFINCGDYGCYYPFALISGNKVGLTYAPNADYWEQLQADTLERGTAFLHICYSCTSETVRQSFPLLNVQDVPTETEVWKLFRLRP